MIRIETNRLILRAWEDRDAAPFAAMNADPRVMEFFPATLTEVECRERIERAKQRLEEDGFGFLPVELKTTGEFVGWVGLGRVGFEADFTPAVEIGWRLPVTSWGKGYASEAAAAWRDYAFDELGLDEIVAFAVEGNDRSRAVMERIGMTQDVDGSFMHPEVAPETGIAWHVLYRIERDVARGSRNGKL